jgi:hypothetical protein
MPDQKQNEKQPREPKGFTPHSGGIASEFAREQGWDTNEEQRSQTPREKQPYDRGRDTGYGAHDLGDTAEDAGRSKPKQK